jgi:hypothetical protein
MGKLRVKFFLLSLALGVVLFFLANWFVKNHCAKIDAQTKSRREASIKLAAEWDKKIMTQAKACGWVRRGEPNSDGSWYGMKYAFLDTTAALKSLCGFSRGTVIVNNYQTLTVLGFDPVKPDSVFVRDDTKKKEFPLFKDLRSERFRTISEAKFIMSCFRNRFPEEVEWWGGWPIDINPNSPLANLYPEITGGIKPLDPVKVWCRVDDKRWKFISGGIVLGYVPKITSNSSKYSTDFNILIGVLKDLSVTTAYPRNLPNRDHFVLYISKDVKYGK